MTEPCYNETNYATCTSVNLVPSHCTAHHKCWECFRGWKPRTTEQAVALAISLVKFRAMMVDNTTETIAALSEASWLLRQLHNTQWREMTRPAFIFEPPKEKLASKTLTLDDLDLDL